MTDQSYVGRVPFLVSSDGGNCYLRLVPDGQQGTAGHATAYHVGADCGADQVLWKTDWIDSSVVLSNDGHVLMRLMLGSAVDGASDDPVILTLYRDGREFLAYHFSQVVTSADVITLLDGRQLWCNGDLHEWRDNGVEVVDLPLAHGRIVSFDLNTGRMRSTTGGHEHSGRELVPRETEHLGLSLDQAWLAGAALVAGLVVGLLMGRARAASAKR